MPNISLRRKRCIERNAHTINHKHVCLVRHSSSRHVAPSRRRLVEKNASQRQLMDQEAINNIILRNVSDVDKSRTISSNAVRLPKMVRAERRGFSKEADVTVVFAIRRQGCGACRMHARTLVKLASQDSRICLVGAVKHIKDVAAHYEFQRTYFDGHPLYLDPEWSIFRALGDRKLSPVQLLRMSPRMLRMYKDTDIENIPFGGDIWTQGGVLIFDRNGNLRFVCHENYGTDLDLEQLESLIQRIRDEPLPR